ncbi:lipoyl(octanoyl) transferase LipB [Edaphocola flava]|jgi:lipoyl(octanoyl) transferase|uniref:lipoyl(octanoyl) transferase LipB n=1 Tax=Edaphocola flava TaxID=2499629 RepID=UPI00100BF4BB|nr:lipoyl(octanoyl) transferase LipB [Edaphocola flava]
MVSVQFKDLGNIEYGDAWDMQERIMKQGLDIKAERVSAPELAQGKEIGQHLFICEHPHVYTLGKSGAVENLLINNQHMQSLGVTFYKTNRGGDITYHGPGQMVAYPVLDLEAFKTDLGWYMRSLEEVVIRTIAEYGITGARLEGATGVWIDADNPAKARKICAMGVRCSRWITIHGLALNMNTDLNFFNFIVPCGITDKGVTSMQKELNGPVDEAAVKQTFLKHFEDIFGAQLQNQN